MVPRQTYGQSTHNHRNKNKLKNMAHPKRQPYCFSPQNIGVMGSCYHAQWHYQFGGPWLFVSPVTVYNVFLLCMAGWGTVVSPFDLPYLCLWLHVSFPAFSPTLKLTSASHTFYPCLSFACLDHFDFSHQWLSVNYLPDS